MTNKFFQTAFRKALLFFFGYLTSTCALSDISTYVNVINSNYGWYVPVPNMLAYMSSNSGFATSVPIGDQTLWTGMHANPDGSFTGSSAANFKILGETTSNSYTAMSGRVDANGRILILFTPTDASGTPTGGLATLGVGQFQSYGATAGSYQMEMQMLTGSSTYVQHWAYMLPYQAGYTPPQPITIPVSNLSPQWAWASGTVWRIVSPTLFGSNVPGRFLITRYNGGYFFGQGSGPLGSAVTRFSQLGSITPEGRVLFNSISAGTNTLNSFYGTISGNASSASMDLGGYTDPTANASLKLVSPYANDLINNRAGLGAANALYAIASSPIGLSEQWLYKFNALESLSGQAFSDAISQTLPVLSGSTVWNTASVLSNINGVVEDRLSNARGFPSNGRVQGNDHVWMMPFGGWTSQANQNGAYGFKSNTGGLILGGDVSTQNELRVGGAFAWANSSAQSNAGAAPQTLSSDIYQVILYGRLPVYDGLTASVIANGGWTSNSSNRAISFLGANAQGNFDGSAWHFGGSLSKMLSINEQTRFSPSIKLDYYAIKNYGYSEAGSANYLNLNINSQRYEMLVLGAEGKISHKLSKQSDFSAVLGGRYNFSPTQTEVESAFQGAPGISFTTYGINPGKLMGHAGLGYIYDVHQRLSIGANYDIVFHSGYTNQSASLSGRFYF